MHERVDNGVCLSEHKVPVNRNAVGFERGDLFGLMRELLRPDPRSTNLLRGTQWSWPISASHVRPLPTQSCHSLLAIVFMCPLH